MHTVQKPKAGLSEPTAPSRTDWCPNYVWQAPVHCPRQMRYWQTFFSASTSASEYQRPSQSQCTVHWMKSLILLVCCVFLAGVLCIKEQRRVARDNTVQYKNKTLQLFPGTERTSYAGSRVEVQERLDGRILVKCEEEVLTPQEAPPLAADGC